MKRILFLLTLLCLEKTLHAQTPRTPYIYTIKADSVKITNTCDTAELIIENHTQTVPGFLFNKGRGRTEFRRVMQNINDTMVLIGPDTLRLHNAWLQGGNKFSSTGKFGTLDNNHIDFYTNSIKQGRWTNTGNLLLGMENSETDLGYKLQVNGTTYSPIFTNSPIPLGGPAGGALRLRWGGGGSGNYIDFYYQDRNEVRGYIGTPSDGRPLTIEDKQSIVLMAPRLNVGGGPNFDAKLCVSDTSTIYDPFNAAIVDAKGSKQLGGLIVKLSGNTIVGYNQNDLSSVNDLGSRLQVYGSAYIRDTLKLPNLVSQNDASNYKPVVADANGNIYKMATWNASGRKSVTVTASPYTVPADVDVVFVNFVGTANIILPSGALDREITIKNLQTSNTVALSNIDPSDSNTITGRGAITVKYTGSSWVGISRF